MNLKYLIKTKNKTQKQFANELHISETLLSNFNNYVCLPTPSDMDKICEALKCGVLDVYDKEEITFLKPAKKRSADEIGFYRLTITLPSESRKYFDKAFLKQLGYADLNNLIEKLVISKLEKKKAKLEMRLSNLASEINSNSISHQK